jgi:UDP-N-acetylglucosamine acyltransferase
VEQIAMANKAYKILYRRGLRLEEAVRTIADLGDDPVITMFIDSVERSTRGIIR